MSETDPRTHRAFISAESDEREVVVADSEGHVVDHPPGEDNPELAHEQDHIIDSRRSRRR
jgi:hypothetical protein